MNGQIEKLESYFKKLETSWSANPNLLREVNEYEAWEQSCYPKAFSVVGPEVFIGDRMLRLPAKRKFIVYITWNFHQNRPELIAENNQCQYRFTVIIKKGKVGFLKDKTTQISRTLPDEGEQIEVVYDVIDLVLGQKPDTNIFKLKKADFTSVLKELDSFYDEKLLKQMARLTAGRIKMLIEKAAGDMAIDDLSSQLSLPMENSYAHRTAGNISFRKNPKIPGFTLYPKTRWEIVQEMGMLCAMVRFNHDIDKGYTISLKNSEVISCENSSQTVIRVKNKDNIVFHEGNRLNVLDTKGKKRLGTFVVGLFDYQAMFGKIYWDTPGESKNLKQLCLQPQNLQHKIVLSGIEALYGLVKDNPGKVEGALREVLGLNTATIYSREDNYAPAESESDMDFSQLRAWSAAIDPKNPITAVQGPPGTGKTRTLIQIIRHLCRKGYRLLVTAPSNKAVDNVCISLTDLPVLRFGRGLKIDPAIRDSCWANDPDNVDKFLKIYKSGKKTGVIYAATHVRALTDKVINGDRHQRGLFDWVVCDESGMSRMDEFLLCTQLGKRIIAFGDQQQLSPFPLSAEVMKRLDSKAHSQIPRKIRQIINLSALEWLTTNRHLPLIMLDRSYRCQNPRLMRFSSTLFYHGRVKTSQKAEYFRLPYYQRKQKYPRSTLRFYCTSTLPENKRCEIIVAEDAKIGIKNPCEAVICRHVLLEALLEYPLEKITVITPYKLQAAGIRTILEYESVKNLLPKKIAEPVWNDFLRAQIATVDSFQGGESDMVIISYVRSNPDKGIGFVDNPNRINVAHTRCRRAITIIGDLECLKHQAKTDIFIRMERAFVRDGEIIDMDEELFDQMSQQDYA